MWRRSFALPIAAILVSIMTAGAAALAPDERGRERIGDDDDPIIVPALVVLPEIVRVTGQDPETTGSIDRGSPALCDRFAYYPRNAPEKQFREAC